MAKKRRSGINESSTPLFIFSADWHIAQSAWRRSGIDGDSYRALDHVIDKCIELRVPLIAAGDLFDSRDPSPEDVRCVRRAMKRMAVEELGVYYTQGNHERESKPWLGAISSWPEHIHQKVIDHIDGLRIYGLDWQPASALHDALHNIPADIDVLVCHQVWTDFMGSVATCEGSLADVPPVPLICTGDYHVHQWLNFNRPDGSQGTALSAGSICMQSIDEEHAKHVWVVGRCLDGTLSTSSCRIPGARSVYRYAVDSVAELDALLGDKLCDPDDDHRPIVSIRLPAELRDQRTRVEQAAAIDNQYHLFLAIDRGDAAAIVDTKSTLEVLRAGGLAAVLDEVEITGDDAAAVRSDVAALVSAVDPLSVLDAIVESVSAG